MKMRRMLSILIVAAMVLSCALFVSAADKDEEQRAEALYELNLFKGVSTTTKDFALDKSLNRAEGIVMLIRMLGVEQKAISGNWSHPFTDLTKTNSVWADKYIGYAYENGLTNGTGKTTFSGGDALTDQQFATMCLRSLGYSDSGALAEFKWNDSTSFAAKKGILTSGTKIMAFDRGNAVEMIWSFVNAPLKNSTTKLADRLISEGVFTSSDFTQATNTASGTASGSANSSSSSSSSSASTNNESTNTTDNNETNSNSNSGSTEVKTPTTWEEFEQLTQAQKYKLSQKLGEEEYQSLVIRLQKAYQEGAFEISDKPVSLDENYG